jgi:hypothetical protein
VAVDLEKDKKRFKSLDRFEQLCLVAHWHKMADLVVLDVSSALEKYKTPGGKVDLIGQMYGDVLGPDFAPDIGLRLEWYKKRKSAECEKKSGLPLTRIRFSRPSNSYS